MFYLCANYAHVVHGPVYGGSDAEIRYYERSAASRVDFVRRIFVASTDEAPYPAMRLSEAPFLASAEVEPSRCEGHRLELTPLWHTWLTGLYRRREVPQELWYPGGTLADAAGRIAWRDR
jgi:hypothetical protein